MLAAAAAGAGEVVSVSVSVGPDDGVVAGDTDVADVPVPVAWLAEASSAMTSLLGPDWSDAEIAGGSEFTPPAPVDASPGRADVSEGVCAFGRVWVEFPGAASRAVLRAGIADWSAPDRPETEPSTGSTTGETGAAEPDAVGTGVGVAGVVVD